MTLTQQQAALLAFIRRTIEETGRAPAFEQMAAAVGLKSKSGVSRLVKGLEERGAIKRLPHLHGAIELVPGFAREIDVDGEKATVWFEMRKHPDRFGLVRIIEFPEGLQVWVGGELRWKSYA